jgi:isochorismate synthase
MSETSRDEWAQERSSGDDDLARAFTRALRRAVREGQLLSFAMPAPVGDPLALLGLAPSSPAVLWEPPNGPRIAGLGVAAHIRVSEGAAFPAVRAWAAELTARILSLTFGDARAYRTKFFGGFAFDPSARVDARWSAFGTSSFMLPELLYEREGKDARLVVFVDGRGLAEGDGHADVDALLARVRAALRALEASAAESDYGPAGGGDSVVTHASREGWGERIREATDAIHDGALEKVVLARESRVEFGSSLREAAVLARLRSVYPECFTFAVRVDGAMFLGATPERLVRKEGAHVVTEALAGSIAVGEVRAPERLRASAKDAGEHEVVVRHIVSRLGRMASDISYPKEPGVRVLANVIHLATPIHATLRTPREVAGGSAPDIHVLDIVEQLHPTPAVGGAPLHAAMAWIRDHEGFDRGWYAGPVGWFDSTGDGEFGVALRSGLVRDTRAWLFGGAGIVRDSDAGAEYEETALKLRALLGALSP